MKRLLVILLALATMFTTLMFAQESDKKAASPRAKNIVGTIGSDGTTFTTDKDQKSWTIVNPDAVKGHEGHHVKLNAHIYADKDQVHVMKVSMMTGKSGMGKKGKKESKSEEMKEEKGESKTAEAVDVVGTIGADGKTFTSDSDQKSWTIVNPEAVKGHEGHHVKLNAHVYADKGQVHVMSVAMMM